MDSSVELAIQASKMEHVYCARRTTEKATRDNNALPRLLRDRYREYVCKVRAVTQLGARRRVGPEREKRDEGKREAGGGCVPCPFLSLPNSRSCVRPPRCDVLCIKDIQHPPPPARFDIKLYRCDSPPDSEGSRYSAY